MRRTQFVKNELNKREWCDACGEVKLDEENSWKGTCLRCCAEIILTKKKNIKTHITVSPSLKTYDSTLISRIGDAEE